MNGQDWAVAHCRLSVIVLDNIRTQWQKVIPKLMVMLLRGIIDDNDLVGGFDTGRFCPILTDRIKGLD
jgi:hypothetical protein